MAAFSSHKVRVFVFNRTVFCLENAKTLPHQPRSVQARLLTRGRRSGGQGAEKAPERLSKAATPHVCMNYLDPGLIAEWIDIAIDQDAGAVCRSKPKRF